MATINIGNGCKIEGNLVSIQGQGDRELEFQFKSDSGRLVTINVQIKDDERFIEIVKHFTHLIGQQRIESLNKSVFNLIPNRKQPIIRKNLIDVEPAKKNKPAQPIV